MKKCPKSAEPAALTAFRAARPDATWEQMKNDPHHGGQTAYRDIKRTVVRDQRCLCAYCEMPITNGTSDQAIDEDRANQRVEHFHAKSDPNRPPNWALHWPNLWGVCKGGSNAPPTGEPFDAARYLPPLPGNLSCDSFKDHQTASGNLPLGPEGWIISPHEVPAFPRLFNFTADGKIHPDAANCGGWIPPVNQYADPLALAAKTIEHLNLNCNRLVRAQNIAWARLEKQIAQIRNSSPGAPAAGVLVALARRPLSRNPASMWAPFFSLIRSRLGAHAEQHLQSIGYDG